MLRRLLDTLRDQGEASMMNHNKVRRKQTAGAGILGGVIVGDVAFT